MSLLSEAEETQGHHASCEGFRQVLCRVCSQDRGQGFAKRGAKVLVFCYKAVDVTG